MFAGIKRRLGLVEVTTTPTYIVVEGFSTLSFTKDMYRVWGNNTIAKYMFSGVRSSEFKLRHFFGLDFLYICRRLYDEKYTSMPKRVLGKIIEELEEKTWLGQVGKDISPITDLAVADKVVSFTLKPFQREFVEVFGKMVPAYRLKGYMLDAGAGTGKTVTDLVIAASLHANKVIIVTPKNAAERVWEATITDIVLKKQPYWLSVGNKAPSVNDYYFICHYESLEQMLNFVKANPKEFKNTFVILDESHNFNRIASDRTQFFIELCNLPQVTYNLWASGTPIQALGTECIPFLKCVDPLFDSYCEEAFRKIYGRDAKRANDILRNRIGHLKYHVPQQDVVHTEVIVETVKVKMPNAKDYTLENIGKLLREFIDKRREHYAKHRMDYVKFYEDGLKVFQATLKTDQQKREFAAYQSAFKVIAGRFDPQTMKAEAQICNQYELKTIIPVLNNPLKNNFKGARSVIKYVDLKIMGEALGTIVGGMRSKCHVEMVKHIDFNKYIDDAEKKTLIFTSYVEVLESVADIVDNNGYKSGRVYGATNKDLASIVGQFYKDEDLNPLCATYQSLSTAVPLTAANTILMINQPFRDAIRTQTIARANRLGQDKNVYVFDFLLDTGDMPNISTRSNDILLWSQNQVSQILGVTNVDVDTLALESADIANYSTEVFDLLIDAGDLLAQILGIDAFLDRIGARTNLTNQGRSGWGNEAYSKESVGFDVPHYLYHGSMYKQHELMPGFQRSGELVRWDGVESNEWLYATTDRDDAVMLGIGSALEKEFRVDRYSYDAKTRKLTITSPDQITPGDLRKLQVFLYTIRGENSDEWLPNFNQQNGIENEYKTQNTIDESIVKTEQVDVNKVISNYRVEIIKSKAEYSAESFSQMMSNLKKMVFGASREDKKKHLPTKSWMSAKEIKALLEYIDDYFGNDSWLSKQQFNVDVPSNGIIQALSYDGKFTTTNPMSAISSHLNDYKSKVAKYAAQLKEMDGAVQRVYGKYEKPIILAAKYDQHDKFEELIREAIKAYEEIPVPMMKMSPVKLIGSVEVYADKDEKSMFGGNIERKETDVKSPGRIAALDRNGFIAAVKLIRDCLKMREDSKLYQSWLDFEDGSEFSDVIHEYDEPLYMDYYDQYYHQTVGQAIVDEFPDPTYVAGDVILALMAWMDRSIK